MDRLGRYTAALFLCGFTAGPTFWFFRWMGDSIGFAGISGCNVALLVVIGAVWVWEKVGKRRTV